MWTPRNRKRYDRSQLRYPSDLIDDEWALIARLIPPAKPDGNKRTVNLREVMNGVMYVLGTGCQWRALPKDLPPRSTVHDYLDCGVMMVRSIVCTTPFIWRVASKRTAKQARPSPSSIARALKAQKKGGLHRSAWQ